MTAPSKSRKRGVSLNEAAVEALEAAAQERWFRDHGGARLTWAAKADLLGVGVATAQRMLAGECVDRATLEIAFSRVGLPWDPAFLNELPGEEPETRPTEPDAAPLESIVMPTPTERERQDEEAPTDEAPVAPPSTPRPSAWPRRRLAVLLLVIAATAGGWTFNSLHAAASKTAWELEFKAAFDEGQARFHRADYLGAHVELDRALALARHHDSMVKLGDAQRLAGDLAGAEGDAQEAKRCFLESLQITRLYGEENSEPALYEAVGDAETTLGEYPEARDSLERSLQGYRAMGDPTGVSMACRDLGSVAFLAGDLDGAEDWFRRSVYALEKNPKPDIAADVRGRRALVLLKRGRAAEAREELRGCLDYWTVQKQARWIAVSQLHLAEAEAALGHATAASSLLADSEEGFRRVGDEAGAVKAEAGLRRLVASVGKGHAASAEAIGTVRRPLP